MHDKNIQLNKIALGSNNNERIQTLDRKKCFFMGQLKNDMKKLMNKKPEKIKKRKIIRKCE